MNPSNSIAEVQLTYYVGGGGTQTRAITVPANSRCTVQVHHLPSETNPGGLGRGLNPAVKVDSTNGVGLVVERPLYTPTGGDNVMGAPAAKKAWLFAEGYTGVGFEEYLVILNRSATVTPVMITYYLAGGDTIVRAITVGPNQRRAVVVSDVAEGVERDQPVSAKVETPLDSGIVVERAMYFVYAGTIAGYHTVMGYAP